MLKRMLFITALLCYGIASAQWLVQIARPGCALQECILDENNNASINFDDNVTVHIAVEFQENESFIAQAVVIVNGKEHMKSILTGTVNQLISVACDQENREEGVTFLITHK